MYSIPTTYLLTINPILKPIYSYSLQKEDLRILRSSIDACCVKFESSVSLALPYELWKSNLFKEGMNKISEFYGAGISMAAERYGGDAIGLNGGGGRCGNFGGLQFKGVGANALVGKHTNSEHSYGGLDARKAIVETIYTQVLGSVLPRGTVPIHALLFTGYASALAGKTKCWGAILVRDICVRPAHLMRSPSFVPVSGEDIPSDIWRIRSIYKNIGSDIESSEHLGNIINRYIDSMANQFSFALAARLSHGTVSASNLTWDGRWLDLPVTSFLRGAENYAIWGEFYNERYKPIEYLLEIVHNFHKYLGVVVSKKEIWERYNLKFDSYFKAHVKYVYGLPEVVGFNAESRSWSTICDLYKKVLLSATYISPNRPVVSADDPAHLLIKAFYYVDFNRLKSAELLSCVGLSDSDIQCYLASAKSVVNSLIGIGTFGDRFLIKCALIAFKRMYISEAFYLTVIDPYVKELCNYGEPGDVQSFIDSYVKVGQWGFSDDNGEVFLLLFDDIRLSYDGGTFGVETVNGSYKFRSPKDVLKYVHSLYESGIYENGYNFKDYIDKLMLSICEMSLWN